MGERPDDTRWTGFQNYHPEENFGYITLFRELYNEEEQKPIALKFIKDKEVHLKDLITGEEKEIRVDKSGRTLFKMDQPASFRFYKYTIISSEWSN